MLELTGKNVTLVHVRQLCKQCLFCWGMRKLWFRSADVVGIDTRLSDYGRTPVVAKTV